MAQSSEHSSSKSISADTDTTVIDETTPLIATSNAGPTLQSNAETIIAKKDQEETHDHTDDDDRPLDRVQILCLCYARLMEPVAFFCIFPFISEMIAHNGVTEEADIGFYAGLIESLFSLTQMLCMIPWGWLADRYGRKPILVGSQIGVVLATVMFGFSSTVWQMVVFRCLAGLFSGSIVSIRSMISENSTKKTQARAFSFFSVGGNLGIMLGPIIGGALSNPVEQYPGAFGGWTLFERYPYALANIAAASFVATAVVTTVLFVRETLTEGHKEGGQRGKPMGTIEIVKSPGVANVLFLYSFCSLIALGFTAVIPVFWYTQPSLGGYGFSPLMESIFLAIAGGTQALWTLIVVPPLTKRVGTIGLFRICWTLWPVFFLFDGPICNTVLRLGYEKAFWTLVIIKSATSSLVAMSYTGTQLALNDIAPTHQTLGTLNAIAMTLVSLVRAFAPALFSSLFAFGVKYQIVGGQFVWIILIVLSIILRLTVEWLPEKARGIVTLTPSDEEQTASR